MTTPSPANPDPPANPGFSGGTAFPAAVGPRSRARPFRNWAGNQVCLPAQRAQPATTAEVAALVARAAQTGLRVKAVGAGHSFTDTACTDGILVNLDRMNQMVAVDPARRQVRVQAGIRLFELNALLVPLGLALPNLGDIAYQSIAGAIATATHGTGLGLGNLATTVVGLELVTGDGRVLRCDEEVRPDLWRVARVGLGALGLVTEVTLQCVPSFNLAAAETIEALDDLLDGWTEHVTENDHFEFLWMPGTHRVQVKRNNRTAEPARPASRLAYARDKIVAENLAFGAACRVGRRFPRAVPTLTRLVTAGVAERHIVDRSDRVFVSPRRVRFCEMEYGIAVDALPEALRRVRTLTQRLGVPILFPVEVRCSAADDIALSMAEGRDTAWIAVHMYRGTSYDAYFKGVEQIMNDYDGRPHWGKLHFQDATTLAPRYPRWDDFLATRAELDPTGIFANAYLDRVLGPVRPSLGSA